MKTTTSQILLAGEIGLGLGALCGWLIGNVAIGFVVAILVALAAAWLLKTRAW